MLNVNKNRCYCFVVFLLSKPTSLDGGVPFKQMIGGQGYSSVTTFLTDV